MKIFLSFPLILIFVFVNITYADQTLSEQLVESAWEYCAQNDQRQAEIKFLAAIDEDSRNTRAYLGLSYLYQLQYKYMESWDYYKKVFETESEFYPYVFACMISARVSLTIDHEDSDIIDFYEDLSEECKNLTLQGSVNEKIGKYYIEHNNLSKARSYFNRNAAITDWALIGPFDNISASGFDKPFPPESEIDFKKTYSGKNGMPVKWFKINKIRHDKWIDMKRYFSTDNSVFYGNTFIYSDQNQEILLRLGTSGALKVFLNDNMIYSYNDENNNDLDTYIVTAQLLKGWNRLLLKCSYSDITQCNFYARISDLENNLLTNIMYSSDIQTFTSKPAHKTKSIQNFAELFFEEKIKNFPDHLENYLLLADCYLRNDKAIEAELTLKQALKKSPNNSLILNHLLEAYLRGEKYDELSTTHQKIYEFDPTIPTEIIYKFNQYIESQNYTKAKEMLDKLEKLIPETAYLYQLKIVFYSKQEISEKIIKYVDLAYEKFPDVWDIVQTKSIVSVYIKKNFDEAISILEDYLEDHTENVAFYTITEFYLKASKFAEWEKTLKRLLEYYPAATGYYYQAANVYFAVQDFDKALKYINKTLELCPFCASYWEKKAEIERSMNNISDAIESYKTALNFRPTEFSARDKLRELEGKKPIFSHFKSYNIDSLIQNSPAKNAYPDDNALILLNNIKRVVYERGASETSEEILIKLFNDDGIDSFKEYYISYNSYIEELTIERAITVKSDGSEIEADYNNGNIVFKSLAENDHIYIKWKKRNYYSGKLSNQFWDSFHFNLYYPVQIARYNLLVPENFNFNFRAQNMSDKPVLKDKTEDGILYAWELNDPPVVRGEYNMPGLDDIGKILYLSSIPDWKYVVDWYTDLAKMKTESSYEIKEMVNKLLSKKMNLTDLDKIKIIYKYITENIRYSSVSFRQSSLIPQEARKVLVSKIGDCKDMTTLAISMLKEAGIEANYILINTKDEGLNKNALPSISFNHAIAGVKTNEGTLYLDLTAQNYPLFSLPRLNIGAFALEISANSDSNFPYYLSSDKIKKGNKYRESIVKVGSDNSISVTLKTTRTYMQSAYTRNTYRFMSQKERKKKLTEVLSEDFTNIEITEFELTDIDSIDSVLQYTYTYKVPNYINEAGDLKLLKLPWTDNLSPRKSLSYESRVYDYNYWPTADTIREKIEVHLPKGFSPMQLEENIEYSSAIADYSVHLSFKNGIIYGIREYINKKQVVTPELYKEFKDFYNKALKKDENQIVLIKK